MDWEVSCLKGDGIYIHLFKLTLHILENRIETYKVETLMIANQVLDRRPNVSSSQKIYQILPSLLCSHCSSSGDH